MDREIIETTRPGYNRNRRRFENLKQPTRGKKIRRVGNDPHDSVDDFDPNDLVKVFNSGARID